MNSNVINPHNSPSRSDLLCLYLVIAIFANLFWLFWEGHFDIGFWEGWINQLIKNGYANYTGDYPPVWSHWLYLVSRFYVWLNLAVENNLLFKFLTQIPILVSHLILIRLIYSLLKRKPTSDLHFHTAMMLTVFNPAILFVGPVWGQIDVVPTIPVIAAIVLSQNQRYQIWSMPLYTLSLLIKFQMIAFAPVMGLIFLQNYKKHISGIIISIVLFFIAFLPAILADNFVQAFKLPYISSMSMFSSSTMNATNLWFLTLGNYAPDNMLLFGVEPNSALASIFHVKRFGMLAFSIVCLFVTIAGLRLLFKNQLTTRLSLHTLFFYSTICAVTFFTLLPGMHERYLLPAVIISLAYFAYSPDKAGIYVVATTFISTMNISMTHDIKTDALWNFISWLSLILFFYLLLNFVTKHKFQRFLFEHIFLAAKIKKLPIYILLVVIPATTYVLFNRYQKINLKLSDNQIALTTIKPHVQRQDYGVLTINQNISRQTLSTGGKRYANGFGTHANSTISFLLPPNASKLSFIAGLDEVVVGADVQFSVWGDGKMLWQSVIIYKPSSSVSATVDIKGVRELTLKVSGIQDVSNDHANWINPVIEM